MGRRPRWGILAVLWGAPVLLSWGSSAPAISIASVTATKPSYLASTASLPEPNDPAYNAPVGDLWVQWPLHQIGAHAAWQRFPSRYFNAATRPQETPIVAIVDTGVDEGQPEFLNSGATSAEVSDGGQLMLSAARTFLSSGSGDSQLGAHDEHGHGTHLAGLIAAATNNATGIAGVAYPARLLPLKVGGASGGVLQSDAARAVTYAADLGASVILIGITFADWSQTLQTAIDYAWDRGCLVVAPAGDTGDDQMTFPGAYPHVLAVAASTAQGQIASYSTRGTAALAAPGGDGGIGVYSTLPTYACTLRTDLSTPAYGWLTGTPMAAAHAAGAAALYAAETGSRPRTGDEGKAIWRALQQSAVALDGATGWDVGSGYGLLAADRLLAGENAGSTTTGSIVGRVLLDSAPGDGAVVTATDEASGRQTTASTSWPAGAYRIAGIPSGSYTVTAELGGNAGMWERVNVFSGCDAPGVDFALGSPPADAALVGSTVPATATCGKPFTISATFRNTGAATWTRGTGYQLVLLPGERTLCLDPDHANLPSADPVKPGEAAPFAITVQAPERWGVYETSWQMAQQGGVGRFGPVVKGTVEVTSFADVGVDHWAIGWVEAAKAAGVVSGYGNGYYDPTAPVTRAQMAVYLARALVGEDAVPSEAEAGEPRFADVAEDYWAFKYVQFVGALGIAEGYPGNEYRPEVVVNRGQMAIFVARATATPTAGDDLGGYQPPAAPSFEDVQKDHWAYRYVEFIKSRGVASGYPDKLYHPGDDCTRDQMAVYVVRAFGLAM